MIGKPKNIEQRTIKQCKGIMNCDILIQEMISAQHSINVLFFYKSDIFYCRLIAGRY